LPFRLLLFQWKHCVFFSTWRQKKRGGESNKGNSFF
jgi:hypothetical protein